MFNVFRMHMYRVSRSRSTYVMAILLFVFFLMAFGIAFLIYDDPLNLGIATAMMEVGGGSADLTPEAVHRFFIQNNDSVIIILTIFGVLLANCDFSKGFAKNTYCMFEHKSKLVFAKWTALVASVSIAYVVMSVLALGMGAVLSSFSPSEWDVYLRAFIVVYICLISMLTMVFMITSLFKSPVGGMVIGLVIATGLLQTVEKLLDLLIAKISGADMEAALASMVGVETGEKIFRISDYCLDNVYLSYNGSMGTADTVRTVVVALVYMAVALGLAMLLSEKKDVKC